MKKNIIFIVIGAATILTSCTKRPEAIIRTEKPEVVGLGSIVKFTNLSENTESIEWILPDGSVSTDNKISYTFNKFGLQRVKLTAYSIKEKKSDEVSVSFDIQMRQKDFVGTWYGTCGTFSTTLYITASGPDILLNIGCPSTGPIKAAIGYNLFFFNNQVGNCNGDPLSGSGTLSDDGKTLTLKYEYGSFPPFTTNCTFVK